MIQPGLTLDILQTFIDKLRPRKLDHLYLDIKRSESESITFKLKDILSLNLNGITPKSTISF